jgi:hypothetical protein
VRNTFRKGILTVSGIIAALLVLEAGLRPLATADLPPLARPAADSLGSPVVTSRQLEEGIAESHFSSGGARLTGNSTVAGAPLIVILGDSHVVAREVTDRETMGSWVERLAREQRSPVNVRQYGWRGASPPQYLMVARDVMAHWHPAQVVVVLDGDDLGPDPLNRRFPRMRIGKNDVVQLVRGPREDFTTSATHHRFTLATLARIRWQHVIERTPRSIRPWLSTTVESNGTTPPAALVAAVPRAEVKALARAFGPNLLIVYTADVRAVGGDKPDAGEERLLAACAAQNVRCVSMRPMMLAARRAGYVVRGFPTTTLGVGHMNAKGHELVGHAIWQLLRPAFPQTTSQLAER